MVLDIILILFGHFRLFLLYVSTFHSHYNTDSITNMEICLDPKNSVNKRLWCRLFLLCVLKVCIMSTGPLQTCKSHACLFLTDIKLIRHDLKCAKHGKNIA